MIKKMINPFSTNSYILVQEGHAVLVDPVGDPEKFAESIAEKGAVCSAIIYTHGHYDHIASAEVMYERFQVPLYIHVLDKEMLYDAEKNLSVFFSRNFFLEPTIPIITMEDGQVLEIETLKILVHHTPGHTPGSVCLESDSDLYTGDTLFEGSIGRTDFPGSDHSAMEESLKKLKEMDPALNVHPGHGASSTLEQELKTNHYLR